MCRDLKGENILQSSSGRWVLCDFGSAQTIDMVPGSRDHRRLNDLVQKMTTAVYRAPEVSSDLHEYHVIHSATFLAHLASPISKADCIQF
jgi:serine/threonine protein kinase